MLDPLRQIRQLEPATRVFSLWEEFRAFAFKGNVIDLAIGVIIGAAFGKLVDSLVRNLIMPLVSVLLPDDSNYQSWKLVIHGKDIPYGHFIADVLNFLIVALAVFLFIKKFLGWAMKIRKDEVAALPPLTKDQELLTEIRDLLKNPPSPNT